MGASGYRAITRGRPAEAVVVVRLVMVPKRGMTAS
jgi:hypothetical protein